MGKVIEAEARFLAKRKKPPVDYEKVKKEVEALRNKLQAESTNEEIRKLIDEYKLTHGIMKDKNGRWVQCLV